MKLGTLVFCWLAFLVGMWAGDSVIAAIQSHVPSSIDRGVAWFVVVVWDVVTLVIGYLLLKKTNDKKTSVWDEGPRSFTSLAEIAVWFFMLGMTGQTLDMIIEVIF